MSNLFQGEEINLNADDRALLVGYDSEAINEKNVKGELRIVTEQARYPLNTIVSMVESGTYELNPGFQRRHRWDNPKRSRLIESFIMNVPIPPIFLYEDQYSHYEVMDGLQRMSAIYDFYKDHYRLEGLQEWRELNGLKYSGLPYQVRKGIDRRYLSSIIISEMRWRDVVYDFLDQIRAFLGTGNLDFRATLSKMARVWPDVELCKPK